MSDQANRLRELVRCGGPVGSARPRLVVVSGGKGGVGTTLVSVHLAMLLHQQGHRTMLVDADCDGPDVATRCGLDDQRTLADVLSGRYHLSEVDQAGPDGLRVVAGVWGLDLSAECSDGGEMRFLGQIEAMGESLDVVTVDVGAGTGRLARWLWRAADAVVLVTSPELPSVMNAYATVKILAGTDPSMRIHLVVNRVSAQAQAEEVFGRLAGACMRFLGVELAGMTVLPRDPLAPQALARPESPAVVPLEQLRRIAGFATRPTARR